jgi:transposase
MSFGSVQELGSWAGGRVLQVADELVPDGLWDRVAPLLRPRPLRRRRYPGRLPADDRAALRGIVYAPRTGLTWADVLTETIGCSRVTCWRRLRDWTEAGVRPRLRAILLAKLRTADPLDIDDAVIDGSHVRALKGGLTPDLRRSTAATPAAIAGCGTGAASGTSIPRCSRCETRSS